MVRLKPQTHSLVVLSCLAIQGAHAQGINDVSFANTAQKASAASARGGVAARSADQARLAAMAKSLPDIGRPYSMRVTVGATTNAGFEQPLIQADPSLRHWCWIPVTSFRQATVGVDYKHAENPVRPEHVYVKPNHVPLPVVDHGLPVNQRPITGHYIKPNHIPLPVVDNGVSAALAASAQKTTSTVSATIRVPHRPISLAAVPAKTKTYGDSYASVSASLLPPRSSGISESRTVHGVLLNR